MERNPPVTTNKVWSSVRVILFIIRKNMSKTKLLLDLNLMIKRGKIAAKALQNLIVHHQKESTINDDCNEVFVDPAVLKALEMLTASPAVHGFGKSPMVRQLRITDSPFPLTNGEEDSYVDEAAEKFIIKFYNDLRRHT